MNLPQEIITAEDLYRFKLENFFSTIYTESNLHSHGIEHHRRVWIYSRELISYPETANLITEKLFPLKLLIASYLHDSGMSVDHGPRHGHISRTYCEQFLGYNNLTVNDFTDVLEAVENHDNKDYLKERNESELLKVLTVADDMDALGYTGIYRYLEIYLKREIPFEELGDLIKSNVTGRFSNMVKKFAHIAPLIERESLRFEIISEFCQNYNNQLPGYKFGTGKPSGYCGIAEMINMIPEKSLTLESVFRIAEKSSADPVLKHFFKKLEKELSDNKIK